MTTRTIQKAKRMTSMAMSTRIKCLLEEGAG
jgi:hypothetical protein